MSGEDTAAVSARRTNRCVRKRLGEIAGLNRIAPPHLLPVPGRVAATQYWPARGTVVLGRHVRHRLSDLALLGVLAHECAHLYFADGARGRARMLARHLGPIAVLGAALALGLHGIGAVRDPLLVVLISVPLLAVGSLLGYRSADRAASLRESQHCRWRRELRADFYACRVVGRAAVAAGIEENLLGGSRPRLRHLPVLSGRHRGAHAHDHGAANHPPPGQRLQAVRDYDMAEDPDRAAREWLHTRRIYDLSNRD